jgi:selenide,water dikinase
MSNLIRQDPPAVRLTSLSHGAGCGCKLGPADLAQVLRHVPAIIDPNVLVDSGTRDDAAVYRLSADRALVVTTDFFTPIVDDPATWGAIAAANALSDIYAMGGKPLFALNLVGWPRGKLPMSMLGEVLRGAREVTDRVGCPILGGHSIDDPEPKFGMVVVGDAHPDRLLTNAGAAPGDLLVLTKPLGVGILSTALKKGILDEHDMDQAIAVMTTLNDGAAAAALAHGATAATDVTGFGLIGHLKNIVDGSSVGARLDVSRLPLLNGVVELAAQGSVSGGTRRNLETIPVQWGDDVSELEKLLCADAQTSGGLLIAIPENRVRGLIASLQSAHTPACRVIGEITNERGVIRVSRGSGF